MEQPETPSFLGVDPGLAVTPEEALRLRAWLSLGEDSGTALLDGRIVRKAMGTIEHGAAWGGVFAQLHGLRRPSPGNPGWWLANEPSLYLAGQGTRPDIAGWRRDRHPQKPRRINVGPHMGVYVTAPDWVCEVLSPSTRSRDEGIKADALHEAGVEHYWFLDVANRLLSAYRRELKSYALLRAANPGEMVALPPFESVQWDIGELFEEE